jgi:hypothetical protein
LAAGVLAAPLAFAQQPVAQRVVAVSGGQAPGTEAGTIFYPSGLQVPTVNARGDVAFGALLDVATHDFYRAGGIWMVPGGSAAGTAPTMAYRTETWSGEMQTPFLDDAGRIAFWTVTGSGTELRVGRPGEYRTVVRGGDPAPGAAGWTISGGSGLGPILSGGGTLYFEPVVGGSGPAGSKPAAYTVVGDGSPQVFRYTSGAAPGVPGATMGFTDSQSVADGGRASFVADLVYGPNTPRPNTGVFSGTAGDVKPVAITGQAAPGLAGSHTFYRFWSTSGVNASGATVFTATAKNAAGVEEGFFAYVSDGGQLTPMAGPGMAAPALGAGYTLRNGMTRRINDRGQAVVKVKAVGPDAGDAGDAGFDVWMRWAKGALAPIVRDGAAAPGLGAGVTLTSPEVVSFNDAGQSLVRATLAGPGVNSANNNSLWAVDPLGQFSLVARTGMTVSGTGGTRVVTGLLVSAMPSPDDPGGAPRPQALSDSGQVAYLALFDDGQDGAVLATLPSVIAGDVNNDLVVDLKDFDVLYRHLNQAGDRTAGDLDYDGVVSFTDYQVFQRNFGRSIDGGEVMPVPEEVAALVPEPGVVGVIVVGAVTVGARRRRRAVG